jgi:hypothetical protein
VRGRLVTLEDGWPALVPAAEDVLATGTRDALADVEAQRVARAPLPRSREERLAVDGDLLELDEAPSLLPSLDHYEGFVAGAPSLYVRVLVPVFRVAEGDVVVAWTYVAGDALPRT